MTTTVISLLPEMLKAFGETLYMIGIAFVFALALGLPLGILLFVTGKGMFLQNRLVNTSFSFVVNIIRSIPYIILIVALIPLTRFILLGNAYGPTAASVSLTIAAIPFFARLVETSMKEIDKGVIEAAIAVGATPKMIIKDVLLPEAKPGIIQGLTITLINLVAFSAMAGFVGGGGIGDVAIRYGYYRYDNVTMFVTVTILIVLVQIIQITGDRLSVKVDKR
ncbi:MAG TPA: ABC transporter permease [Metalysinibacillus jejuensis]|uniref:ABC transporter permease n=1 Tax=Metalysinibacillus jejuensis TaxID=914327 RepID=A0A921NC87_9BACL|nr:ABC transporter permease [Metalysinibacillus jejuensis]